MSGPDGSPSVTEAADWAAATASVRGASHERTGLPNQDGVAVVPVAGPVPGLVAAVADGHGGARYVRSDVGARLAVDIAGTAGAASLRKLGASAKPGALQRELAGSTISSIVEAWARSVRDHLAAHPFTDEERARAGAPLDGDPLVAYGCTLVMAVCGPGWIGLLQVGDGDATLVAADGTVSAPVPGDDRLVGGETTSLCLPTAVADARTAVVVDPLPSLVVLTSDGYANSFAAPDWREQAGADLLSHVRDDGLAEVASRLPTWLADSAVAGGDDVSMALLECRGRRAGAGPGPRRTGARSTRPAGAQVRPPIVAGLVVAALALGALGGWLAGRGDGDDDRDGATPTTTAALASSTTIAAVDSPEGSGAEPTTVVLVPTDGFGSADLVAFDPVPGSAAPRVVGTTTGAPVTLPLPTGWTLQDQSLRYRRTVVATGVRVVQPIDDVLWAVIGEGAALAAYGVDDGEVLGREPIARPTARGSVDGADGSDGEVGGDARPAVPTSTP